MSDERCTVLIVGAGPAGLFTASTLVASGVEDVLVIDAGRRVGLRRRSLADGGPTEDLVFGEGGAGLFSDGKLCLSLAVGGDLPTILTPHDQHRVLDVVAAAFGVRVEPPTNVVEETNRAALGTGPFGLERTSYPVAHLGSDYCANRISELSGGLNRAGRLRTETILTGLYRRSDGTFVADVSSSRSRGRLIAQNVVLAMGKSGASRQSALCASLGASFHNVPMYIGVRIEADSTDLEPLFEETADPKYKLVFDDGTKCKTHCGTSGGEVLAVFYDGLPIVAGHAYSSRASGRSSIAVLWDGVAQGGSDTDNAVEIMRRCSSLTGGRLLAQRIEDYLVGRPSDRGLVAAANPTTHYWAPGDMRAILPPDFFPHFDVFLERLRSISPNLAAESALMYGPAIEWWMKKVCADDGLETDVPGLFVAGDGAGWSQGIVHAAASGVVVAERIVRNGRGPYATLPPRNSPVEVVAI